MAKTHEMGGKLLTSLWLFNHHWHPTQYYDILIIFLNERGSNALGDLTDAKFLKRTGSTPATRSLEDFLKQIVLSNGPNDSHNFQRKFWIQYFDAYERIPISMIEINVLCLLFFLKNEHFSVS